jgi:hypothetical protein
VFWLSFVSPTRPEGDRFLGVCLIEVSEAEVEAMRAAWAEKFPQARVESLPLFAAMRKSWVMGCNPGGEVGTTELPEWHPARWWPKHRLLLRAEILLLEQQGGRIQ